MRKRERSLEGEGKGDLVEKGGGLRVWGEMWKDPKDSGERMFGRW